MGYLKPLATYPGRKAGSGTWQQIISQIPKCELFIEAMAGSAFISSQVKGCKLIVNDINGSVIDELRYTADNVSFMNLHYKTLLELYSIEGLSRVFYFDPPYLMETRSYKKPIYKHEWNEKDHREFLKLIVKVQNPVLLSHYPCKLYDTALKNWRKIQYNTMTRAGVRKENLYMNFPQPVLLQCFNQVGENFTDRQRIKRKVERFTNKLKRETAQERAAILSCIIENFSYAGPDLANRPG